MVSYLLATRMLNFRYRTALTWLAESGFDVNERTTNPDSSFTSLAALGIEFFCVHISSLPLSQFSTLTRKSLWMLLSILR